MSIAHMAGRLITVWRRTAYILDSATATASMSADRQPPTGAIIQITVGGGTGTVKISGTVNALPDSETLTFTAAGTEATVKRFTALDTPAFDVSAGLVGQTIQGRAVGVDGSRLHQAYQVATNVRAHLNRGAASWPNTKAGSSETEPTWFGIDYTTAWAPREGDVFVDQGSSEQWLVVGDPNWLGGLRPHHWEVRVKRNEGKLSL